MRHLFFSVLALCLVTTAMAGVVSAQALPTDPALVTGKLDNGLTYIIRRHAHPPDRATIWLHMNTGSLNETDPQRGLAHYLEHMAFNGSENFPPGQVVPFFQSLGMTFGRDQNAFTSFDQTTFQLTMPNAKLDTISKGMMYFGDVLHRLTLTPTEINAERQIIQEERRRSLSGQQRTMYYVLEHMAPGSIFGQRITIGTEKTIDSVQQADFRDYYGKWYVASNATLMVVADADPQQIVKLVEKNFGDVPKVPQPKPQDIGVKAYDKSFAIVASDPEVRNEQIRITRLEPARPPTTTVPQYRDDLVARLGTFAMNRRLEEKVATGKTSYLGANVSLGNDVGAIYTAELSGRAKPGKWRESLDELAVELQRARLYGFAKREIEDAKKEIVASAKRAVQTEPTREASSIIRSMNQSVSDKEPIMSAEQRLDLIQQLLPTITPDEVGKRFAKEFDPSAVAFIAILPSSADVPTEEELLALGTKALSVKPDREAVAERATQLMEELPQPGKAVELTENAPTHVWSGWLSNNARVHYRYMDARKDEVSIRISLLGGELHETDATRGLTQAAMVAWSRPATQHLSSTDVQSLMIGKNVSVRGGGGMGRGRRGGRGGGGGNTDSITLSVSGSPEDLETGMQLAYLLLTEPKVESATLGRLTTMMRLMLEQAASNPMLTGMRLVQGAAYPADVARTQPLTIQQLDQLNEAAAQKWLNQLIATSPIEVSIVGDLSKERVLELVARYIGSLPQRQRVSPTLFSQLRDLTRPAGPRVIQETVDTETPQAFVYSAFYGPDDSNLPDTRAMSMATMILSMRMIREIREDEQLVYSISASSRPGTTYPGFGLVAAGSPTDPAKAERLREKIASMYATMAKEGVTADELEVAKKQIANTFETQLQEPGYWLSRLTEMTFYDRKLDDIINAPAAYQAITAEQVRDTFARYYSPDKSVVVVVMPGEQ